MVNGSESFRVKLRCVESYQFRRRRVRHVLPMVDSIVQVSSCRFPNSCRCIVVCPVAVFLATEIFNDFNCTFSRPHSARKKSQAKYRISARCSHRLTRLDSRENFVTLHPSIPFIHPSKVSDTKRKQDTYVALVETNRDTGTFLSHRDEIIGDDWLATGRLLAEVVEVGADSKFLQCFWVRRWVHRLGA